MDFKPKGSGKLWGNVSVGAFPPQSVQGALCLSCALTHSFPHSLAVGLTMQSLSCPRAAASSLWSGQAPSGAEGASPPG